jgi:PPK2 family polyphosphate:nucleotide phosphotransferase
MKGKKLAAFLAGLRVAPKSRPRLGGREAGSDLGFADKSWARKELKRERKLLKGLQARLYAGGKRSLLVVLQAMDTGGKDGTIRKVLGPLNPQGVEVTGFKRPTDEELAHDFLWRIHKAAPRRGMIGVFNRSHYEDVLVVRVHRLRPRREIERRYGEINAFERRLADSGTSIVKLCLNITRDEQKERLQARLDDPAKHWKFDVGDLAERRLWRKYMRAYSLALGRCSTPWAPWYLVPANRKWVRDLAVARILRAALEDMKLRYPKSGDNLSEVVIED